MVDQKTIDTLEFDKILARVSEMAVSTVTKGKILRIVPVQGLSEVQRLLDTTEEMYAVYNKYNLSPVVAFDDVREILFKAAAGAALQAGELLKVARLIRSARIAKNELSAAGDDIRYLKEWVAVLFINTELERAILDAIAGENEIKDNASEDLRVIRCKISAADARLKEKLASYARTSKTSKYLQDSYHTIRNGRFVLPVKSECRSEIPGLIHDQSGSGATVFIEPLPVVELNNELKSLQLEESREIERILRLLSDMVAPCVETLDKCQNICTMLDIVQAKMRFSMEFRGTKPILGERGRVRLIRARHPLIQKEAVVPVDLSFGGEFKLLLITGPNTGGKTVCLKTVGLFCVMACAGIFPPCAEGSEISVFDQIFCDIGDDQSILNSLSTFSSHILNIASITGRVTNRSLVLLDELGGGTDPAEGAALAEGIIRFLEHSGAHGIITTHYGELKQYAVLSKTVQNACMQFDEQSLKPTFKLIQGIPGASHALKISASLGLDPFILKCAREAMDKDKVRIDQILSAAEQARAEAALEAEQTAMLRKRAEEELAAVEKDRATLQEKAERFGENARLEMKRVIGNTLFRAHEIIGEIDALKKEADERALLEAKRLYKRIEELSYTDPVGELPKKEHRPLAIGDIQVGMHVFADGFDSGAVVVALPDKRGEVIVRTGNVQFKIHASKILSAPESPPSPKENRHGRTLCGSRTAQNSIKTGTPAGDAAPVEKEIMLLGMTVFEAIEALEPLITSHIGQLLRLKIIHGKGTGALGKGIQKYLKSLRTVKSVRYGRFGEGENGVTFAEFEL
ncbi:MAG: endonuclease MutS2 [Firmicutes bacterium]|nr:endonuclease MutS2 [Bacillota bacterium]